MRQNNSLPHSRTSVEMEVLPTNEVIRLLGTKDGTVGPILREGKKPPPAFLVEMANGGPVENIEWYPLSFSQKRAILESQNDFHTSRRMPGVHVIERLLHSGQAFLENVPEYVYSKLSEGIEIKMNRKGDSADVLRLAYKLVRERFKSPLFSLHSHQLGAVWKAIQKGDIFEAIRLVEFTADSIKRLS